MQRALLNAYRLTSAINSKTLFSIFYHSTSTRQLFNTTCLILILITRIELMKLLTRYIIVSILIVQLLLELSRSRYVRCRKNEKKTISKTLVSALTKLSRMMRNGSWSKPNRSGWFWVWFRFRSGFRDLETKPKWFGLVRVLSVRIQSISKSKNW
jgi:uncharacterized membrane protein YoaT (DUF817 family)